MQLGELLRENYDAITALDAEVLTISHEPVAINKMLAERFQIQFPWLSDTTRSIIREYDARDGAAGIARITFFAIDKDGIIRWRSRFYSSSDPNDLPLIDVLLDAIKQAQ